VQRLVERFEISNFKKIKQQLLHWSNQYSSCSFLDNNQYFNDSNEYKCIVGVGDFNNFSFDFDCHSTLKNIVNQTNDWLFGHVAYSYKNELFPNKFQTNKEDKIGFPAITFFQPMVVVLLSKNYIEIQCLQTNPMAIFEKICNTIIPSNQIHDKALLLKPRISKEEYIDTVHKLRYHISKGDCYEINFCQEFYAENATINPLSIFEKLNEISPNPFACYYKLNKHHLMCASPERYLKKEGNQLISQPIKGSIKRNKIDKLKDDFLKNQLLNSQKERSENVMVVDLVRNDLSKICKEGTVNVSELFGLYTFPQIHQMISTITGVIEEKIDFSDVLDATFPMGSMTGAPKKKVMELIDKYESTERGLFSGTVGYITPEKDFDFNVVIRSLFYNDNTQYLNYQVGSGITYKSIPEDEYEECLLKAKSIRRVLSEN
jgi:para-aminobenzoate synthetase component 1